MGPQSRLAEFNLRVVGSRGACGSVGPSPRTRRRPRAHFPRGERYDRFSGRHKPRIKVTRPFAGASVIGSGGVGRPGERGTQPPCPPYGSGPRPQTSRPTGEDCSQCSPTAVATRESGVLPCRHSGSVANRSAPYPTRLETRTKESNMRASHGVLRNLKAQ